jgi:hypothetical protein
MFPLPPGVPQTYSYTAELNADGNVPQNPQTEGPHNKFKIIGNLPNALLAPEDWVLWTAPDAVWYGLCGSSANASAFGASLWANAAHTQIKLFADATASAKVAHRCSNVYPPRKPSAGAKAEVLDPLSVHFDATGDPNLHNAFAIQLVADSMSFSSDTAAMINASVEFSGTFGRILWSVVTTDTTTRVTDFQGDYQLNPGWQLYLNLPPELVDSTDIEVDLPPPNTIADLDSALRSGFDSTSRSWSHIDSPLGISLMHDLGPDSTTYEFSFGLTSSAGGVGDYSTLVGVEPNTDQQAFNLAMPKPNPTSESLHYAFTLAAETDVQLDLIDVSGRRVKRILGGQQGPGFHGGSWAIPAGAIHGGVYFLRLSGGGKTQTRTVVLLN